jgi:hypothetical protein
MGCILTNMNNTATTKGIIMTLKEAQIEVANLPARIAENEAVYGPGCRPELRARLATAQALINSERVTHAATYKTFVTSPEGKTHLQGWTKGASLCNGNGFENGVIQMGETTVRNARNLCERCERSADAQ